MSLIFLKEIKKQLGSHEPEDVDKLILDNLFNKLRILSEDHKLSLEKYTSLKHLSLNNIGLSCLKNFPKLPSLKILELRENLLTGEDLNLLSELCPNILKLKLGCNPIKNIDYLDTFNCSDIKIIELYDTPLSYTKQYKEILFYKIRALEIIDSHDRDGYTVSSDLSDEEESYESSESESNNKGSNNKSKENNKKNNKNYSFDNSINEEEDDDYSANENCEDEFDSDFNDDDNYNLDLSNYELDDKKENSNNCKSKQNSKLGSNSKNKN